MQRLDITNQRLGVIKSTVLGMAEQQRFLVRHTRELSERDSRLETRVGSLETRVQRLEAK